MNEKKGNTVKLEYDFDTARNLEIYLPSLNNWVRVTSREFRSFNGKRKIQDKEYNGNLYLFGTNKLTNGAQYEKNKIIEHKWKSVKRPGE
jgi:hypothetical protein